DSEPWASVSRGQRVKVQGQWHTPGSAEYPALGKCIIVDKGTFTTPVITASALVREYSLDKDAFLTKYGNQDVIVTGAVEKRTVLAFGPTVVKLRTDGDIDCICNTASYSKGVSDVFTAPLPGQEVKYYGRFSNRNASDKAVSIHGCLPITKALPK